MSNAPIHPSETTGTSLKRNAFGIPGILFFVLSAQAPLTSIVGAAALAVALGNGAGAPGAYLIVGAVIVLFAVGFTTITRHLDVRGGFFAVIRAGLGFRTGAGGSLLALLAYNAVQIAMYGLLGASTAGLLARQFGVHTPWWLWIGVSIAAVWFLGSRKIEIGTQVLAVLVGLELLILVAFAVGVLFRTGLSSLDVPASFGPDAILAGAPGVAIMFAIASMFGFESTAIYSTEARNPRRTVPRATYIAVVLIAVFLALVTWMLVSFYGAARVREAAGTALSGDPAVFALDPIAGVLGPWAGTVAEFLLCTSLFAGVLSFHNMITRYFHAMAGRGLFPAVLERTNRHQAPAVASLSQSLLATAVIAPFAVLGLNPVSTLFNWFSGLAVATLIVLYTLTSAAVVAYFRRHRVEPNRWTTLIAPVLASVLMLLVLTQVVGNFGVLTGGSAPTVGVLLGLVPLAFLGGLAAARRAAGERPEVTAPAAESPEPA
ncbi:APC family permease [Amycolatopsis sp. YIM 10]|uniref:APC family permease n=1 Tax=Amycolatopsis sp. YIM 10 TaxID=2653857 RepID=UPI0012903FDE|nr:APC family permease [Amycolatopsis sp. YIM 10]QFU89792.1 putrescine transporter [Amycolatopsis sp. YIM 10]